MRAWIGARESTKEAARQLGATPRSVENWQEGQSLPQALHLIAAMRESDEVFAVICELAGRQTALNDEQRRAVDQALSILETGR